MPFDPEMETDDPVRAEVFIRNTAKAQRVIARELGAPDNESLLREVEGWEAGADALVALRRWAGLRWSDGSHPSRRDVERLCQATRDILSRAEMRGIESMGDRTWARLR